jgi:hypothetical protein
MVVLRPAEGRKKEVISEAVFEKAWRRTVFTGLIPDDINLRRLVK